MLKKILSIVALAMAAIIPATAQTTDYSLKVNDFSELKVVDDIDVIYRCNPDSAGMATFTASADKASAIMFQPDGNKLSVVLTSDGPKEGLPVITLYSTYLTRVENAGKGTVRVFNPAAGPKLKAQLVGNGTLVVRGLQNQQVDGAVDTGNGTLILEGTATAAHLRCVGAGQIQADELKAANVKASMWGTGSIGCNATQTLSVKGTGTGKVYYIGSPEIKNHTLGVKVLPLGN